ncbi:uncharacterized protein LOC111046897 isoform X1 [Nilaparvata lugens]|uniref:uncharacterized protein LOC111046897 isoform X1 n=1 Tax=Nilaparvata lugens TaxID=108931 RepID=UPI00193D3991|nr:uncharacterized protein LOC111046897 isoform X1 [Nilaparvata lugens]
MNVISQRIYSDSTYKSRVESVTAQENLPKVEKILIDLRKESSEMDQLSQEAPISGDLLSSKHDCCDILEKINTSTSNCGSKHSPVADSAIDIYESCQSFYNSSVSSDLATECIYHDIMKQRNLLASNTQSAKLANESELAIDSVPQHFGFQSTPISSGDFSAAASVHQDNVTERHFQENQGPNGDTGSKKSDSFSRNSTVDEEVEIEQPYLPKLSSQNKRQDEMNNVEGNGKMREDEKQNSSAQDSSSIIDRAYASIMFRYGGFRHFNPDQFSGNMFGKRDVSYAWNYREDDTSSHLTKSDSIRNLLEAMHAMGVKMEISEDQPSPDSSAPQNSTTGQNKSFSRDTGISGANEHSEFRNQAFSNIKFNSNNYSTVTKSENTSENAEMSGELHQNIQKLLVNDLQTNGCLNEESAKALNTTVNEFSQWINKLVAENEKLKSLFGQNQSVDTTQNQEPLFSSAPYSPDNLMKLMVNSERTKKENLKEGRDQNLERSLLSDLQANGCLNKKSCYALSSTIKDFSGNIDELVDENRNMKKIIGNGSQLTQCSENNQFVHDIKVKHATEEEICELLRKFPNSTSIQELFSCEDSECKTMVVGDFSVSSNLKTLVIRKKANDGQVKYVLLELSPNVTVKTTCKPDEFEGEPSFTVHLMTSHYKFSLSL